MLTSIRVGCEYPCQMAHADEYPCPLRTRQAADIWRAAGIEWTPDADVAATSSPPDSELAAAAAGDATGAAAAAGMEGTAETGGVRRLCFACKTREWRPRPRGPEQARSGASRARRSGATRGSIRA